jgi:hypothetical protein
VHDHAEEEPSARGRRGAVGSDRQSGDPYRERHERQKRRDQEMKGWERRREQQPGRSGKEPLAASRYRGGSSCPYGGHAGAYDSRTSRPDSAAS